MDRLSNKDQGTPMKTPNVDNAEIAKFSDLAARWWDPLGDLKTLHDINPLRTQYINTHYPLADKKVLDIGCGGGILSESMAKLGAHVTGIDMSDQLIQIATLHAKESHVAVEYLVTTIEEYAKLHPQAFDAITCMELLEHVPDPEAIIKASAALLKPQGSLFLSTLNRNLKSYLFAIVGAEYLLKMLPKNTHDYAKFIRPSELSAWARSYGLRVDDITGITYQVFSKKYHLSSDSSVHYLMHLTQS